MSPVAPVAQLDRALPSEGKGHTFESCRVRQFFAFPKSLSAECPRNRFLATFLPVPVRHR